VKRVALVLLVALLAGCTAVRPGAMPPPGETAAEAALLKHIEILASDDFEGRRPGTEGETKTLRYLAREWQAAGLQSGTNDPSNPWYAPVELSLSIPATGTAEFARGRRRVDVPADELAVFTSGRRGLVEGAPLVFVGEAGERLDRAELAGRIAVMLWDHEGQVEQRDALFEKGASAVLAVVRNPATFRQIVEQRRHGIYRLADENDGGLLDGFMSASAAQDMLGANRFNQLVESAREPEFRPLPLGITGTIEATSTPGTVRTHNLIARLPGKRPETGAVLLLAHWDHFGECAEPPAADLICNGAVDNASGLAVLTELAKRLAAGPRMDRDVYFLATTAEEWGLLGARAFAQDPPIPLDSIVAAFNLDAVAVAPSGSPVAIIGAGLTGLDGAIEPLVRAGGRRIGDEDLARQFLRRQDGWALLQRDVPAVSVTSAFGQAGPLDRYLAERYHQPSDEAEGIELGGAAEDLLLHVALVRHFADAQAWPRRPEQSQAPH
jgi:hypothetical protein